MTEKNQYEYSPTADEIDSTVAFMLNCSRNSMG